MRRWRAPRRPRRDIRTDAGPAAPGKSGKQWSLSLRDRRVAKVVRSCQELPGQHLFGYRGEDGAVHAISSSDVNAYLREISGRDITAKDFRTWAGTVKAAMGLSTLKA